MITIAEAGHVDNTGCQRLEQTINSNQSILYKARDTRFIAILDVLVCGRARTARARCSGTIPARAAGECR